MIEPFDVCTRGLTTVNRTQQIKLDLKNISRGIVEFKHVCVYIYIKGNLSVRLDDPLKSFKLFYKYYPT